MPHASLRDPGAVLLVSCYELGRQPLALASAMAWLERAGFAPAAIDISVERLDDAALAKARLVVIAVPMHTAMRLGVAVAARARAANPAAHVAFAGLYATLNETWLFESGTADSVIGGEVEEEIVKLASSLGRISLVVLQRLDHPVPSRASLPGLDRYAKIEINGKTGLAGAVEASRGCKHLCTHCPIPPVYGGRFFAVEIETVLADIAALAAAGATHVTFADPDFLNGPSHARRVAEAMHARFPALTWDFTAKIEHLLAQRDLLPVFASQGCVFVVSAVESLSPRVLEVLQKHHTKEQVTEALALTRAAGIALRPSLLPFTPWSTLEDYRELITFVQENDLTDGVDPIQLTIRLLVPPGSLLENDPAFVEHRVALDPKTFSWTWKHPDARMDALQKEATAIVAEAAKSGVGVEETFARLAEVAGVKRTVNSARAKDVAARRPRAPRLTEPWFC